VTERSDIRADLEPDPPDDVIMLAERLRDERPLPEATFRGRLGRHLATRAARVRTPQRVRALISVYATAGSLLLAAGALGAGGFGPLG
jgi:hypothetical protein